MGEGYVRPCRRDCCSVTAEEIRRLPIDSAFSKQDINFAGTCKTSFKLTQDQFNKTVTLDSGTDASFTCNPGTQWAWVFTGKTIPNFPGPATLTGTITYGGGNGNNSKHECYSITRRCMLGHECPVPPATPAEQGIRFDLSFLRQIALFGLCLTADWSSRLKQSQTAAAAHTARIKKVISDAQDAVPGSLSSGILLHPESVNVKKYNVYRPKKIPARRLLPSLRGPGCPESVGLSRSA